MDLKLHDIPNTVKKSMAVLSNLDVDMINLHAGGTKAMMAAGLEGLTRKDGCWLMNLKGCNAVLQSFVLLRTFLRDTLRG